MKNATETLWKLIRTLTAEEKKIILKLLQPDHPANIPTNEQRLFDWFGKSEVPDESEAIKSLYNKVDVKTFRVIRNSLYKKIMLGLRDIEDKSLIEKSFHERMEEAYVLQKKGLSAEAFSIFKKIATDAEKLERYYAHLQALGAQLWLLNLTGGNKAIETVASLRRELSKTALLIHEIHELHAIYSQTTKIGVRSFMLRSKSDIQIIKELGKHPLLKQRSGRQPYFVSAYTSLSRYNLLLLSGKFEEAYHCYKPFYYLTKERFENGQGLPMEIISAGMDYSMACINTNRYEEGSRTMDTFSSMRQQFAPLDKSLLGLEIYFRSYYMTKQGGYDLSCPEHQALLNFQKTLSPDDPAFQFLKGLQLVVAELYERNNQHEKAIDLLEKIAAIKSTVEMRAEVVDAAKLMRVMYGAARYIQLRGRRIRISDELFSIRAGQYYESLKKSRDNYCLEKRILRFFIHLKDQMPIAAADNAIRKLKNEIDVMHQEPDNLYMKSMLRIIDFDNWLNHFQMFITQKSDDLAFA